MTFRLTLPIVFLLLAACAGSGDSYNRPAPAQAVQTSEEAVGTPAWMRNPDYAHGGPIPPMEEKRAINEQSCTQDINIAAGNLRCK